MEALQEMGVDATPSEIAELQLEYDAAEPARNRTGHKVAYIPRAQATARSQTRKLLEERDQLDPEEINKLQPLLFQPTATSVYDISTKQGVLPTNILNVQGHGYTAAGNKRQVPKADNKKNSFIASEKRREIGIVPKKARGGRIGYQGKSLTSGSSFIRRRQHTSQSLAIRHGQALALYAKGDPEEQGDVVEMLSELGKSAPTCTQVYVSLGLVYEEAAARGDGMNSSKVTAAEKAARAEAAAIAGKDDRSSSSSSSSSPKATATDNETLLTDGKTPSTTTTHNTPFLSVSSLSHLSFFFTIGWWNLYC